MSTVPLPPGRMTEQNIVQWCSEHILQEKLSNNMIMDLNENIGGLAAFPTPFSQHS